MTTAQKRQKTSMQGYRLEQCSVTYFYTSVPNSTHHVLQQLFKMHCLTLNSFSLYLCVWCVHAEGEREGRSRRTSTEQKLTSPGSRLPCAHASRGRGSWKLKAGGLEDCAYTAESSVRAGSPHSLACVYRVFITITGFSFIAFEIITQRYIFHKQVTFLPTLLY